MFRARPIVAAAFAVAAVDAGTQTQTAAPQSEQDLMARARAIHVRVITLDTHNDIDLSNFTPGCNYGMRLTTQVNLPKMKQGGLDVSFMTVYADQPNFAQVSKAFQPTLYERAYRAALAKIAAVHLLTDTIAPRDIELALTPADVVRIATTGKKVAVIGLESGYPIGTELTRVKEFWDRGVRYLSLARNGHSQLADSSSGEATNQWAWGGLSPLGRQVVETMNTWGLMVDVSHLSKGAMMQAIGLSKAPVIASDAAVRRLANVSGNLDDEMLLALKSSGGVVQVAAVSGLMKPDPPERTAAINALDREFGVTAAGAHGAAPATAPPPAGRAGCRIVDPSTAFPAVGPGRGGATAAKLGSLTLAQRADYERRITAIDKRWPAAGRASVKDFVDHIEYAVKLAGIDHVGIASDFDGGGGVDGWNSAAETFNVTLALARRGYTEEQIGKIWSGNLLRVWSEVEHVAAQIQAAPAR